MLSSWLSQIQHFNAETLAAMQVNHILSGLFQFAKLARFTIGLTVAHYKELTMCI